MKLFFARQGPPGYKVKQYVENGYAQNPISLKTIVIVFCHCQCFCHCHCFCRIGGELKKDQNYCALQRRMLSAIPQTDLKTIIVSTRFASCCKVQQMRFPKKISQASSHQQLCNNKKAHLSLRVPKIFLQQNEIILLRKDFGYTQTKCAVLLLHKC